MNVFTIIYTALGGLGIFFFGMNMMSDALQSAAGDMIKKAINSLTSNRFFACLVGIAVTCIIQSSSVTTVMVVGFVNAGLMQLTQAIGIILGANIGTTITGWIISIKIGKYGLLFIGMGIFPALFAKSNKWRQLGRTLFGVGMIFFGLTLMSGAFKPLRSMPEFLDAISYFSGDHYSAYFACIIVGCCLTMIIQSSSAMLGITIALAMSGVIQFNTAVALVLGQNIGTTITAILAAIGGNVEAKRAAWAHAIFNVSGVVFIFMIFPFYLDFIEWVIPGVADYVNEAGERPHIAVHVATGHSIFNIAMAVLFLPLITYLANLVKRIVPDKATKEGHHLVVLGNARELMPTTALIQASTEIAKMQEFVGRMFDGAREYVFGEEIAAKKLAKIKRYEQITDNIQKEITVFICNVLQKSLSAEQSKEAQLTVKFADELESIADYLDKLCTLRTKFEDDGKFEGEVKTELFEIFEQAQKFFGYVTNSMVNNTPIDKTYISKKLDELRFMSNNAYDNHIKRLSGKRAGALITLTYSDMIVSLRKIREHSHNIAQIVM